MSDTYAFPFYVCDACAHTTSHASDDLPRRCENCGNRYLSGFVTLDDAEGYSQSILDEEPDTRGILGWGE